MGVQPAPVHDQVVQHSFPPVSVCQHTAVRLAVSLGVGPNDAVRSPNVGERFCGLDVEHGWRWHSARGGFWPRSTAGDQRSALARLRTALCVKSCAVLHTESALHEQSWSTHHLSGAWTGAFWDVRITIVDHVAVSPANFSTFQHCSRRSAGRANEAPALHPMCSQQTRLRVPVGHL